MDELIPPYRPDIWKNLDECYPEWIKKEQKETGAQWVNVDNIIGTCAPTDRFWKERFLRAVSLLLDREYDFNNSNLPVLFKRKNEYFVASDGRHRTLAFKYLKIKKMKARVVELI